MKSIADILVATDLTLGGRNAARRAALLARQLNARVTLLHAVGPPVLKPLRDWLFGPEDIDLEAKEARSTLRKLADELAGAHDVEVRIELRVGHLRDALSSACRQADLLVIGPRGRQTLKRLVTGGTADHVLRAGCTPVLVVRRKVEGPYRSVLVPIGLPEDPGPTVAMAASLAPQAGVQVFHAFDPRPELMRLEPEFASQPFGERVAMRDETRIVGQMRRSIGRLDLDHRRLGFAVGRGAPVPATLRRLRASPADLVVVGRRQGCVISDRLLSGVSGRLLTEARCDTLVVPRSAPASMRQAWPLVPTVRPSD